MSTNCSHQCYDLDEISGWATCQKCKLNFMFDEYVNEPFQVSNYKQDYCCVTNFTKFIKALAEEDNRLPDYKPIVTGFIRFVEAYNRCKFRKNGKAIGNKRNLFGNAYVIYRIAKVIGEYDPPYNYWVEHVKPLLPPVGQVIQLDDHWTQLNAKLPFEWQSERELIQLSFHPRQKK